ncbi:hypothetical protein I862_04235 [endosymbiont of Acanthamoeba sp. UWC8]|uniref:hypothetical protein n=1 Tax=endosymbiont of Acanthamoeba sp. UWC8 TaxID=86106 RepID=UPI0004D0F429|nr:hypothetical protein [endosymbiont of Acanthamoeba sp. UWC8]AIF81407.1 hypothetical protein I862_04235 [endosymbiont of Acanthamoeba sp. UWC8]
MELGVNKTKVTEKELITKIVVMQLQIENLTKALDVLTQEVKILTAFADQGRGSLRMLLFLGALWTGIIAFLSFIAGHSK